MKNLLSFSSSNPNIILIGAGTQWDVYRYHNEQRVHGQESLVIKVPIHNSRDIKKNIENYN